MRPKTRDRAGTQRSSGTLFGGPSGRRARSPTDPPPGPTPHTTCTRPTQAGCACHGDRASAVQSADRHGKPTTERDGALCASARSAADQYVGRRSARHNVGSRGVAECACVDLRGRLSQGSHRHGVAAGRQPITALSPISPAPLVSRRLGSAGWPCGARRTSSLGTCSRAPRGTGHRHRGAVGSAGA